MFQVILSTVPAIFIEFQTLMSRGKVIGGF